MEALRIHLTQASANYRREEIIENKMTYPLPPFSTVIGALHSICEFKEYHPMDISIQGEYQSLNKEAYMDYSFLNSVQDDRNILIKMANPTMLSKGYTTVAQALKPQGNSFRYGVTVAVENEELINEYRELKDLNDKIAEFKKLRLTPCLEKIKKRKTTLANKKKSLDKQSAHYKSVEQREKDIKLVEKQIRERFKNYVEENYTTPIGKYRTLTKSLKFYEVLYDIELIIHVHSNHDTLVKIYENINNLKCLGRSEDFVNVIDAKFVELEAPDQLYHSSYHAYIDASITDGSVDSNVMLLKGKGKTKIRGMKYYLNKNYTIEQNKRVFEKKKVYYISEYEVDEESTGVYVDKSEDKVLIVNLI